MKKVRQAIDESEKYLGEGARIPAAFARNSWVERRLPRVKKAE